MEMDVNDLTRLSTETWDRVLENERDVKQIKRTLPKLIEILNRFEGLEEWRVSENLWVLKKYDEDGLIFSRIINGVQEEIKMDEDTFKNIKKENFDNFGIKLKESKTREYIYADKNGLEVPESLVRCIKEFTFPKGFGFDPIFKKKSSDVDKKRVLGLIENGEKTKVIAEQMGCSESYISQLKKKFSSKDLKPKA